MLFKVERTRYTRACFIVISLVTHKSSSPTLIEPGFFLFSFSSLCEAIEVGEKKSEDVISM